jgi:hypothetical protein
MILLFQVGLLDANGDLTGFRDQNLRQNSKFRGQFILTMPCNLEKEMTDQFL